MKKIFLLLIVSYSLLTVGCNAKDDKDKKDKIEGKKPAKEDGVTEAEETDVDETSASIDKVASGICNCMGDAVNGLSSDSKKILVRASKSSNPPQAMQEEIMNIEDAEDKQRIGEEFTKFGALAQDPELQSCVDKLEKKYKVDDKDVATQKQIMKSLESDGKCSVVAALMNIGFKEQANKKSE